MPVEIAELTIRASVVANEVVQPGSTIELGLAGAVDPQSAQSAIRVMCGCTSLTVPIEVTKRGRVIVLRLGSDTIGTCALSVKELLSAKGARLVEHFSLPFSVIPISGKIPAELRVEHTARLSIGELSVQRLSPGQLTRAGHVDAIKAVHRTEGTPIELGLTGAVDPQSAQSAIRVMCGCTSLTVQIEVTKQIGRASCRERVLASV